MKPYSSNNSRGWWTTRRKVTRCCTADTATEDWRICNVQLYARCISKITHRAYWGATRAFSVAGPTVWNSLPGHLRDPAVDSKQFRRELKTYLFARHSNLWRINGVILNRALQIDIYLLTYLLTYYSDWSREFGKWQQCDCKRLL